jgi:diacylglycerol kinase family enzyme
VIVKKISPGEIFKMRFTHNPLHPEKTELLQTKSLKISAKRRMHFQVDGEYRGKIASVIAEIVPEALVMLVPPEEKKIQKSNI